LFPSPILVALINPRPSRFSPFSKKGFRYPQSGTYPERHKGNIGKAFLLDLFDNFKEQKDSFPPILMTDTCRAFHVTERSFDSITFSF
jgi:hypothetical protein